MRYAEEITPADAIEHDFQRPGFWSPTGAVNLDQLGDQQGVVSMEDIDSLYEASPFDEDLAKFVAQERCERREVDREVSDE